MSRLDGKAAVITGAAQGIGFATAEALAAEGASVTVFDINSAGAGSAAERLGPAALPVAGDVADEEDVARMVAATIERFGRLDILVNNAAAFGPEIEGLDNDAQTTPVDVWDRTLAVNLRGAFLGAHFALPHMLAAGGGVIVNISSTSAFSGDINHVAYAASKAGMHSLARSIATSHGARGIRANAVATGLVLSPTARHNLDSEKLGVYRQNILVGDFATPADIASIVVFLATDGHYIQGQALIADGGFQAHQPWHMGAATVHPGAAAAAAAAARPGAPGAAGR
jgi:NAD(P)-dependent dehydrogenase (short-subunit alcohol dehydrogenase family)